MNLHILFLAIPLIFSSITTSAQLNESCVLRDTLLGRASEEKLSVAMKNYTMGMQSDNDGLVESSLYYAMRIRIAYPEVEMEDLKNAIDNLAEHGRTSSIRFKAHIGSTVFASPSLVDAKKTAGASDISTYFVSLSEQLQQQLLVQKR